MLTFPKRAIEAGLPRVVYDRLIKLLMLHYAYPLPYPLAGANFEVLFASAVEGEQVEGKLLFDVVHKQTGWSLKTLKVTRAQLNSGGTFEVVLQRCDILKDRALSLDSPTELLGERILSHFGAFAGSSYEKQGLNDPRAAFLLRDRSERKFAFFQQRYRLYDSSEVDWKWATEERKSLIGSVAGSKVLRWYRSGTQLFGIHSVPKDAHSFEIVARRADLDETVEFFSQQGIARAKPE